MAVEGEKVKKEMLRGFWFPRSYCKLYECSSSLLANCHSELNEAVL